jgi:hypothetical protein
MDSCIAWYKQQNGILGPASYAHIASHQLTVLLIVRAVFTHGPKGPEPMAENFQGWHTKKIEIEVWYAGEKKAVREREI